MSSYRSYAPWKSNLQTSYKSGSSSAYSSRDDISGPRYGSLASPSTYRPSFSGGTYRIKREPPPPPVTTYVSRYATNSNKEEKDKTNNKDTTTAAVASSTSTKINRYTTTSSANNLSKYGRSRDPSPAAIERTNSRIKSRDPSPAARTLRGKSRDPSPAVDTKSKIGSYSTSSSYRVSTPRTSSTTGYSSRYGSSSSVSRTPSTTMPDKSISYLSASDFRARSVSRAREIAERKSNEKEPEQKSGRCPVAPEIEKVEKEENDEEVNNVVEAEQEDEESEETESTSSEEAFIPVAVVTRATSPTPPGSTTVQRTRRIDIAKTIEKTIQRSTKKPKTFDKEIQSDRLDDSTRYSRFGLSSRVSPYSPHSESRYTPTSMRYSASPLSSTTKSHRTDSTPTRSESDSKRDDSSSASAAAAAVKTTRSSATSSSSASSDSKSGKSKLSPPKSIRITARQASVENLASSSSVNKSLPPTVPKSESPIKSSSSSSTTSVVKWPNKDFRKSALNVGPTDRPRKSRTPSSGTESDDKLQQVSPINPPTGTTQFLQRQERSPSITSDASNASSTSNKREPKSRQRCHAKISATPTQSSNTSSSAIGPSFASPSPSSASNRQVANKSSKAATTVFETEQKSSTSTASSSESSGENANETNRNVSNSYISGNTCDSNESTKSSANQNRTTAQPPVASDSQSANHGPRPDSSPTSLRSAAKVPILQSTTSNSSAATTSHAATKTKSSGDGKTFLIQKLGSVSNFFVARQQDANSEPIFIESSEGTASDSGGDKNHSLSEDPKANVTLDLSTTNETTSRRLLESDYSSNAKNFPPCTSATEASTTGSTSKSKSNHTNTGGTNGIIAVNTTANSNSSKSTTDPLTTTQIVTSTDELDEPSWLQDTSQQINTSSALDFNNKDDMRCKLRHIDSGEVGWWLPNDEDDDTLADVNLKTLNQDGEEEDNASEITDEALSMPNSSSENNSSKSNSNNASWWSSDKKNCNENRQNEMTNENEKTTNLRIEEEGQDQKQAVASWCGSNGNSKQINSHERSPSSTPRWSPGGNHQESTPKNGTIQLKICRVESGERPWWLDEDDNSVETVTISLPPPKNKETFPLKRATSKYVGGDKSSSTNPTERSTTSSSNNLSGDKSWWMSGPTKKLFNVRRVDSGEKAWWMQDEETNNTKLNATSKNSAEDAEIKRLTENGCNEAAINFKYFERPPPLGDRASPDGLEDPSRHRKSPYDNIPMSKVHHHNHHPQEYCPPAANKSQTHTDDRMLQQQKLFISRHTNIDELLGGSCRPLSPIVDHRYSATAALTDSPDAMKNVFLEEITPDQVRIHDSTAKMPVIQRMERDEWDYNNTAAPAIAKFEQNMVS